LTAKRVDRRIERTQQLLHGALIALVQEKGFEAVTVQEIIDRANVGRATFYAHFVDKEDLLVKAMDPFSAQLKERQRRTLRERAASDGRSFDFARELFARAEGHRELLRAMVGRQGAQILQRHFQRLQLELVREELKNVARRPASGAPPEAVAQALASALYGLLVWWMDSKPRMTVDEVYELFRKMAAATTKAVL